MSEKEYVEIDVTTVRDNENDDAVLFDIGDEEKWIPRSLLEDWPEEGEDGVALVQEWFAVKEELI